MTDSSLEDISGPAQRTQARSRQFDQHLFMWGGFGEAKQNEQTCRLAGLCGNGVKTPVSSMSAPSYAEVQKNPMLAMQAVLKQCSGGYVFLFLFETRGGETDSLVAEAFRMGFVSLYMRQGFSVDLWM